MRGDVRLSTLGQYQIIGHLGSGGMGAVYRAYQPALDRHVAIKVLISNFAHDPQFCERFRREARAIARLDHPNILPVYDFGEQDGCLYIVMPLVIGGTLRDQMASRMTRDQALRVCCQVADALDYAHGQGIIHRDVKPANVLIGQGERPLLADFGIAKLMGDASGLTGTGNGIGTPEYMSPEQCFSSEVDERTDQYALATMVYELLAGRTPFTGRTGMEIVLKKLSEPAPSIRELNPLIHPEVDRVLARALARAASERYSSCSEFMRSLMAAMGDAAALPSEGGGMRGPAALPSEAARPRSAAPAADQGPTAWASPATATALPPAPSGGVEATAARLRGALRSVRHRVPRARLVAALLALAIVGPAVATIRQSTPQAMTGILNFAIAEFGQVNERGEVVPWDNGSRLSQSLYQRLEREFQGSSALTGIAQVRHQGVGLVKGRTPAERTAAAAKIAEQLKAHLVIYGNLERQGDQVLFAPEFYVSGLDGAEELVGPSRLGTPVYAGAQGESLGYALILSDKLKARSEALTHFTVGLTYLLAGLPHNAVPFFEEARSVEPWPESEGKEVVHLFLGTAYRSRGQEGDLDRALASYAAAARLNPEYARAYVGLGTVYYEAFRRTDHSDPALLDLAIAQYERASAATIKPETAAVDARLRVNLGNAFVVKAQLGEPHLYARAAEEYQRVIEEYERGRPRVQLLAAYAYLGLGIVYEQSSDDVIRAAESYRKAVSAAAGNREIEQLARDRLASIGGIVR